MATAKKKSTKAKAAVKTTTKKTASKKVATKKTAAKKAATKKAATKKTTAKKATRKQTSIKVTAEQRYKMICEAAYYISLSKTPETINPTEDWLQAEASIDKICKVITS